MPHKKKICVKLISINVNVDSLNSDANTFDFMNIFCFGCYLLNVFSLSFKS